MTNDSSQAVPPLQVKPRLHLAFLDGIRGFAAFYVALGHALLQGFPLFGSEGQYHLGLWNVLGILRRGHDAVSIFIVLSGFCLMLPVARAEGYLIGGWRNFIQKRFVRIIPTYYAALIISIVLATTVIGQKTGTHWDVAIPVTRWDVITHFLLIQDIFPATQAKINHVFWSISVEWRIYFVFPLLVWAFRAKGFVWPTIVTFIVCGIIWEGLRHNPHIFSSLTIHYTALFALGMAGSTIVYGSTAIGEKWKKAPWAWMGFVAFVLYLGTLIHGVPAIVQDTLIGLFATGLMIAVGLNPTCPMGQFLSWKPLCWLGGIGYSLYLMHAPLLQVFQQYVLTPLGLVANSEPHRLEIVFCLIFVAMPLILAVIWMFYKAFELPFAKWSQALTKKVESA